MKAPPAIAKMFRLSLATRLTIWFAVMAFVLLLTATVLMYWRVAAHLAAEDESVISTKLMLVEALLIDALPPLSTVKKLAETPDSALDRTFVRVRLPDGGILAQTDGMEAELPVAYIPQSRRPVIVKGTSGKSYWAAASTVNGNIVQVAAEADDEGRLLAPYRGRMWLAFGLAFVVAGAIGYRIALHGIQPLAALVETMRGIESSTLDKRIDVTQLPVELTAMGETFNAMLERLQRSFSRVSQFSDDIAHQLRTPLGIIRGQIEVALVSERSAADYQEILMSSLEEIVTLSDLVHRMLFLARAENQATALRREDIDISTELLTVHDLYEPVASEAGVTLEVVAPNPALTAKLDRLLTLRAIGNLVSNAIRHTPVGGTVIITTLSDAGAIRITVTDTGCGIAPEHLPHMFDRFYRADRLGAGGRSGLGLAIVKAIAELHGGSVEISSAIGQGTKVTIAFPWHKQAA
jgi:two-component system, OmpR family, heavy metal sensor histidine kinase CusS